MIADTNADLIERLNDLADLGHSADAGFIRQVAQDALAALAPASASIPADVERLRAAAASADQVLVRKPSVKVMTHLLEVGSQHMRPRPKTVARGEHNSAADAEFIVACIDFATSALAARPSTGGAMDGEGRSDA